MELPMSAFHTPERPQIFFHVKDMTSEHAASVVPGALRGLDERAAVPIDLAMRRVEIDPNSAEPAAFRDAIGNVGYATVRQWQPDLAYLWA